MPEDLDEYFRVVHDHLVRIVADRELLTSVLQAGLAQISVVKNRPLPARPQDGWLWPLFPCPCFGERPPLVGRGRYP